MGVLIFWDRAADWLPDLKQVPLAKRADQHFYMKKNGEHVWEERVKEMNDQQNVKEER